MKKDSEVRKYIEELEEDNQKFEEKGNDSDDFVRQFATDRIGDNKFAIRMLKMYLENRNIFQEIIKWVC